MNINQLLETSTISPEERPRYKKYYIKLSTSSNVKHVKDARRLYLRLLTDRLIHIHGSQSWIKALYKDVRNSNNGMMVQGIKVIETHIKQGRRSPFSVKTEHAKSPSASRIVHNIVSGVFKKVVNKAEKNELKNSVHRKVTNSVNIETEYANLVKEATLIGLGKQVPTLRRAGEFSITGLSLLFFYHYIGKIKTKEDLGEFLKRHNVTSKDLQPRHFGLQKGFYFLSKGHFHPILERNLKPGEYCLLTLKSKLPGFIEHRIGTFDAGTWTGIKEAYDNRCSICSSIEGLPHYKFKTYITKLEKGHMDPRKNLNINNIIPQCEKCNKQYGNKCVFNTHGYVVDWLR